MKRYLTFCVITVIMATLLPAQDAPESGTSDLPYREILPYPDAYTPGTVAARVVDGLGYRYYWATEGLREEDLNYKPSEDARSCRETLEHIYGLSLTILSAPQSLLNIGPVDLSTLSLEELRRKTLESILQASALLKASQGNEMEEYKVIFKRGEGTVEFPFWNMLNGPISDAIYHVGQITSFRRSSGNPINPNVSVFRGITRE